MRVLLSAFNHIEKQAFLGNLIGGGIRMLAPLGASHYLQSRILPRMLSSRNKTLASIGTHANNLLNAPGLKGTVAQMGLHTALSPVVDPAANYIAEKFEN